LEDPSITKSKKYNDNGVYFPIWATCLGFENMVIYASEEGSSVLSNLSASSISLPLKFVKDPRETQMYGWLEDEAFLFEDNNLTKNGHDFGVDPNKFRTDNGLREIFDVTAISYTA